MITKVYLIRHAESAPDKCLPEPEWPLSDTGREQSLRLITSLRSLKISKLYSSPFPRAIDTIKPYANEAGLEIKLVDDFRERKLTEGMVDDFLSILSQAWMDFDFKMPNCESSIECQQRFVQAFDKVVQESDGDTIAIASHGNAIGLFLNSLKSSFGFENWKAIKNPDIFKIEVDNNTSKWIQSFEFG